MEKFKNAKYYVKEGMKVKLRSDLKNGEDYGKDCYVNGMVEPGTTVTVSRICLNGKIRLEEDRLFNYTVEMFENLVPLNSKDSEAEDDGTFTVGDKVMFRKDLKKYNRYGGITYLKDMPDPGTVTTIASIEKSAVGPLYTVNGSLYTFTGDFFTKLSDEKPVSKSMCEAISDEKPISKEKPAGIENYLKVGDVVKIREDLTDGPHGKAGVSYKSGLMIAPGRTAKITSVRKDFEDGEIRFTLDKDKRDFWYVCDMFDLDYVLSRNPRLVEEVPVLDPPTVREDEVKPATLNVKVGDIVRLRSDLKVEEWYGSKTFTRTMSQNTGKPVQVKKIYSDGSFEIEGDELKFLYTPEMIASMEAKLSTKTESRIESAIQDMLSEANRELEDLIRLKVVYRKQMEIEEYSYDELKGCIEDYLEVQERIEFWKSKVDKLNQFLKDLQARG